MSENIIIISYTLKQPIDQYKKLFYQIKKSTKWSHFVDSTWIIKSEFNSEYWSEKLTPLVYETDTLMVLDVKVKDINGYLTEKSWNWLEKNILKK